MTLIKAFAPGLVEALLDEALAIPLALPVLGISGLPGSGKSTLARQLVAAGKARGLLVCALSLDDFYFTRRERMVLAKRIHPLLAKRGPPGTHDLPLAHASLAALMTLKPGHPVALPRFDKLRDRRNARSRWRQISERPRLLVFEGWCLGVPAEDASALVVPINEMERVEDPFCHWRRYCNQALAACQPLWQRLDRLIFLQAPGFEIATPWRWQQEQAMLAARPQLSGMDAGEVERFMQLFERIGRQALRTLPALADRVLVLDAARNAQLH